jgi:hypothetical protein
LFDQNRESQTTYSNNDTLKAEGKTVIFFTISEMEYNTLSRGPDSGIDETLDDFNYYAAIFADTLKKVGYKPIITGSRYIQIKLGNGIYKTYDRLAEKESVVGYIMSDGIKEPKVEYGVVTDIDLLTTFNEFIGRR